MTTNSPCPACGRERKPRTYLCSNCWWLLRPWVRTALNKKDSMAMARLMMLRRQLSQKVPLDEIQVTP